MYDYNLLKHICQKCNKEMVVIFKKCDSNGIHKIYGCEDHPEEIDNDCDFIDQHPFKVY